jgi:hypothetical protein
MVLELLGDLEIRPATLEFSKCRVFQELLIERNGVQPGGLIGCRMNIRVNAD